MDDLELLIKQMAIELYGTTLVQVGPYTIHFWRPWKQFTLFEAIQHFMGIGVRAMEEAALRITANKLNTSLEALAGVEKNIDKIFSACCEPCLI